ncbi:hypothetical protein ACF0H5_002815 [Mactra antiquata]
MEQPLKIKELSQVQNDLYERRKVKNDDTPEVLYERRKVKNDDDTPEVKRKEEKEDEVTVAYETLEHELTVAYDTVENELVVAVLKFMRLKATIARSCQMLKTMKEKKQELRIHNGIICKFFLFVKHWLVINSLLLLVILAVDRYRRVCHPFAKQITPQIACWIIFGIITFSLLTSVHSFYTSDSEPLNWFHDSEISGVGYLCMYSEGHSEATVGRVFHIGVICIQTVSVISLIVTYTLILMKFRKTQTKLTSHTQVRFTSGNSDSNNIEQMPVSHISGNAIFDRHCGKPTEKGVQKISVLGSDIPDASNLKCTKDQLGREREFKLSSTERRLSIMTFILSVASIISFVPYFISIEFKPNLDGTTLVYPTGVALIRRSYILNSVVNPFIMMYFNAEFRQYVNYMQKAELLNEPNAKYVEQLFSDSFERNMANMVTNIVDGVVAGLKQQISDLTIENKLKERVEVLEFKSN